MPAKTHINKLDPFGDNEAEFQVSGIRHSRSRETRGMMKNVVKEEKENKRRFYLVVAILVLIIIASGVAIFFMTKSSGPDETFGDDPHVNPTGRETSNEYSTNYNDPEIRASEQEKLNTVLELISAKDWEYANALFETIFPNYLDTCGKYDYYRAAVSLADNFEAFAIQREVAETRMNTLLPRCDRASSEGN